jgi:hypothetical protein
MQHAKHAPPEGVQQLIFDCQHGVNNVLHPRTWQQQQQQQ